MVYENANVDYYKKKHYIFEAEPNTHSRPATYPNVMACEIVHPALQ